MFGLAEYCVLYKHSILNRLVGFEHSLTFFQNSNFVLSRVMLFDIHFSYVIDKLLCQVLVCDFNLSKY